MNLCKSQRELNVVVFAQCGDALIAVHAPSGDVTPHFRDKSGSACATGYETALVDYLCSFLRLTGHPVKMFLGLLFS